MMPRFFFDIRDGEHEGRGEHGIELPDASRVWEIAVPMLDEIGKAQHHMRPPHAVSVRVRDDSGAVVYRSDRGAARSAGRDGLP